MNLMNLMMTKNEAKENNAWKRYMLARTDQPVKSGDILILGQKGSGKTNKTEEIAQEHFQAGYKVITLDIERRENVFYGFPETDERLVEKIWSTGRNPEAFPHEIYVPLMRQSERPEDNVVRIPSSWKAFKIPFKDFNVNDFISLIPHASGVAKDMVRTMFKMDSVDSFDDIIYLLYQVIGGEKDFTLSYGDNSIDVGSNVTFKGISRQLSDLYQANIISDNLPSNCVHLDMERILRDKNRITSFSVYNIQDQKYKFLILRYVIDRIVRECKKGGHVPVCLVVPEFHRYAPVRESLNPFAFGEMGLLSLCQYILTEGRDAGIKLVADTQNPKQLDPITASNFSVFYVGRMQLKMLQLVASDIVKIPSKKDTGYDVLMNIAFARTGTWCKLWDGGQGWRMALYTSPSRSFHKRASMRVFDVYSGEEFVDVRDNFEPLIDYTFGGQLDVKKEKEGDEYAIGI